MKTASRPPKASPTARQAGLRLDVGGVHAEDECALAEDGARLGDGLGVGAGDGHAGAFGDELTRGLQADAAGAAGDQGALAFESVHEESPWG